MPNIFDKYKIPDLVITDDNQMIDFSNPENEEEIGKLLNIAYEIADNESPTGKRTPFDIELIESRRLQLENELRERKKEEEESQAHSNAWQYWAERERQKTELSVKREKLKKMKRLERALKNEEVKVLLLKVMNREITPERAFDVIKANTKLNKQMMSLTLTGLNGTRNGGKSRIFRRKNNKTRSKSRRNVRRTQHTQRHRKSSTRRSTRK